MESRDKRFRPDRQRPTLIHAMDPRTVETARHLVYLLERLSVDSHWAHRASGLRGALLRLILDIEKTPSDPRFVVMSELETRLEALIQAGYAVLHRAAQEIRTPELQTWLQNYSTTGK